MAGWLYSLAAHLLRLVAWPTLWWLGRRTPAFRERWAERRGRVPLPEAARRGIVVHAVSMGEVTAATPLVDALLAARPDLPLTLTCTTPTASALIRERFGARVHHRYLPFDTPGAMRRFLASAAPRLLIVMETELWPNLLRLAQAQGAAVVVAGGRLSARSARRYARFAWLTRPLLACIDALLVQDLAARDRFLALGAAPGRVRVTGSPKFDSRPPPGSEALQAHFRAMTAGRHVWVAASTHEGEESALLAAQATLRAQWPGLLLVLVPRHPQRFEAVAALLERSGMAWQRRSAIADGAACGVGTAVLLGDTMGELHAWYGVAELAFIGGSLIERGGHSPLEAMACGTPVLSGPHVFNFAEVFERLRAEGGAVQVDDAAALAPAVHAWLADPAAARATGGRGRALFERERGAGARSLAVVLALLDRLAPLATADGPRVRLLADAERAPDATPAWLDPAHWPQREAVQGSGRGSAWFVQAGGLAAVLRHYRRGGQAGRLLGDRYAHLPGQAARSLAEFRLLRRLRGWGLPVPRPLVGRATRHGLFDRCDLLVERIGGGRNLAQRLQEAPLAASRWHALGAAIGRLHACGVRHGDLNCHNLLLDADEAPWILDFDGSRLVGDVHAAGQDLPRLLRSLRKEAGRLSPWHWNEARDAPPLLAGHAEGLAAAGRPGVEAS